MDQVVTSPPSFWIGDTETAGLGKSKVACEVGLMQIDPVTFDILRTHESLIDPQIPIEPGAQAIHGISDAMVAREPTMEEFVTHRLHGGIVGEITMICHNAPFDVPLLNPIGSITRTVCTLFEARQLRSLMPGLVDCKLQTLREHFMIPANSAHRALDDCEITRQVLIHLCRLSGRTLEQLAEAKARTVHSMPWGKHLGRPIVALPADYLRWLTDLPDLEINLRKSAEQALAMK